MKLRKRTRLYVRKKCEGFPIGISIPSRPRIGACCDRITRCVTPFGHTFVIALLAVLISRFRSFAGILPTSPTLGRLKQLVCEGVATECEVRDALKQVSLKKSPGLDSLPYEVYLRLSHMYVPILTDMFNHWFAQGAILGSVTKGVITLPKKGGKHVTGHKSA